MDDKARSLSVKVSMYATWNDSRIINMDKKSSDNVNLASGTEMYHNYFLPDFYVYSLLDFKQSKFASEPNQFISLTPKGQTYYFSEGIITIGCNMEFDVYPFDAHVCSFLIGSTGYTTSFMNFKSTWSKGKLVIKPPEILQT